VKRGPDSWFVPFNDPYLNPGAWSFQVRAELSGGSHGSSAWVQVSKKLYDYQCYPAIANHYYDNGYLQITWAYSCSSRDLQDYRVYSNYPDGSTNYHYVEATQEKQYEETGYKNPGIWKYRVCAFGYPDGSGYACSDTTIEVN
jgi:hypothetical protein